MTVADGLGLIGIVVGVIGLAVGAFTAGKRYSQKAGRNSKQYQAGRDLRVDR